MLSSYFKRLLMARQLRFIEGEVGIFDVDFTLLPADHYLHLRELLMKKEGSAGTALLYAAGEQTARSVATHFSRKFRAKQQESLILWKNIIELTGCGKVVGLAVRKEAMTIHIVSAFARRFVQAGGRKKGLLADDFLAGYLAGIFGTIYAKKFVCRETACVAAGSAACEFVLRPK